jgi:hypothetical protein
VPVIIKELVRLATKAKSEATRVAAAVPPMLRARADEVIE